MRLVGLLAVPKQYVLSSNRHLIKRWELGSREVSGRIEQVRRGRRHIPRTPAAVWHNHVTACVESAPCRRSDGTRNVSRKDDSFPSSRWIGDRDGGEKGLGVRVHWIGEQLGRSRS